MGTHPIFESDFDCLTEFKMALTRAIYANYLGRLSYRDGLALQQALVNQHKSGNGKNNLLLLEHNPVYTAR